MTIDPVKIPADVQVEEKIIGPMSLRQIAILLLTGGFSYIIWTMAKQNGIQMTLFVNAICWIPLMMGIAFSFVQINGVSLFVLVLLAIEKMQKPTLRKFGPRTGIVINIQTNIDPTTKRKADKKIATPDSQLAQLSSLLDSGITSSTPEDQKQTTAIPIPEDSHVPQAAPVPDAIEFDDIHEMPEIDDIELHDHTDDSPDTGGTMLMRDILPPLQ